MLGYGLRPSRELTEGLPIRRIIFSWRPNGQNLGGVTRPAPSEADYLNAYPNKYYELIQDLGPGLVGDDAD